MKIYANNFDTKSFLDKLAGKDVWVLTQMDVRGTLYLYYMRILNLEYDGAYKCIWVPEFQVNHAGRDAVEMAMEVYTCFKRPDEIDICLPVTIFTTEELLELAEVSES